MILKLQKVWQYITQPVITFTFFQQKFFSVFKIIYAVLWLIESNAAK